VRVSGVIGLLRRFRPVTAIMLAAVLFAACGGSDAETVPAETTVAVPELDAGLVATGQPLYETHCAACHGIAGEGTADWRTVNPDGTYNPPPHDDSGHTWHHGDEQLISLIADGSGLPTSRMPAYGDVLDRDEIAAILEYIKTWWGPDERVFQWQVSQRDV